MRNSEFINEQEIRKAIAILHEPGDVFEIRAMGTGKKDIISGYFKEADTLLSALDTVNMKNKIVYITLGKLKEECYARIQRDCFRAGVATTSDTEVLGYRWLFVDLDPVRTAGVSSSEEELNKAKALAHKVYLYMQGLGFEEPVKALSGNGCHLLYKIAVKNDAAGRELIEKSLKTLSFLFDTDEVKIDTTNHNPSRICKLYGTLAQKGASTEERPHRMSRIFLGGADIRITGKNVLERLTAELPDEQFAPPQPQRTYQQAGVEFDLLDFMAKNGMTYKEDSNDRAKIYKLDECPFDHNHRDGDAKIFQYSNGAIAFKCHHNSCRDYRWQDVRRKFDPLAYDRSDDDRIDQGWRQHNRNKPKHEIQYEELTEESAADMFQTAKMIWDDPEPEHEFVRCGITMVDDLIGGLEKTCVSVISGTRASGKSTLIGQIINTAVNDGQRVVCYSGELNGKKYLKWLMRQVAGSNRIVSKDGRTWIRKEDELKIIDWYGDRFWLYNNKFGNKFAKIESRLRLIIKEKEADICIIDNLMALDLADYDKDKYEAQTQFVWALKNLAELTNTHIIFVAHPKKASGFLRLNDISGSGNISNIVDNAFMVHRCNRDFENGYNETYKRDPYKDGIPQNATNIVEIAKNREEGVQDIFVPLFYEKLSKRLRNSENEFMRYGWINEADDWKDAIPDEIPF